MVERVSIQKESAEFLRLQIYGKCAQKPLKRLTKVNLTERAKKMLKPLWCKLYFGDEEVSLNKQELREVHQVLFKSKSIVSSAEADLLKYITLVLYKKNDENSFQKLEKHYNKTLLAAS